MLDVARQVGVEQDVGGAGAGELSLEGQPELLGDAGPGTVEAEQVAGALGEDLAGADVAEPDGDPRVVLVVVEVLGVEADDGAASGGLVDEDGLHQRLGQVEHRARAALEVVTHAVLTGTPRLQAEDLLAGQAGGEHGVAHLVPGRGLLAGVALHAQVAQHLGRALVGDVRPG